MRVQDKLAPANSLFHCPEHCLRPQLEARLLLLLLLEILARVGSMSLPSGTACCCLCQFYCWAERTARHAVTVAAAAGPGGPGGKLAPMPHGPSRR